MLRRRFILGGMLALAGQPLLAAPGLRLMMVRRPGCVYCAQWDREIGPIYARHPEGRAARFEGYPGADKFFGVLRVMLDEARQS